MKYENERRNWVLWNPIQPHEHDDDAKAYKLRLEEYLNTLALIDSGQSIPYGQTIGLG